MSTTTPKKLYNHSLDKKIIMFFCRIKKVLLVVFVFVQIGWLKANANELYFIDAHSQVDHNVVPINKVIFLMDSAGVRQTILSARGNLKGETLLKLSKKNPGRIIPALRTKGNPYTVGSKKYYDVLKKQIATKKYHAIAEVLLYHAKKGAKAPEVSAYPNEKKVQVALNFAIEKDWPFVVHIEFASLHGEKR